MAKHSADRTPVHPQTGRRDERPRAWQRMLSGRRLDLLDPSPLDIEIEDIAHGLARVARWNGQTIGAHALSVAQHAMIVEEIAYARNASWPAQWRLAALLHDAPEYVIGDLISPFKTAIGLDYKSFELRLLDAIHRRFGLPSPLPAAVTEQIKDADRVAAYYEATVLAGFTREEGLRFFGAPPRLPDPLARALSGLEPLPTGAAQRAFLARFAALAPAGG
jgi:5'-deoxynucleotidase YfbR-like HD superfamily hydrolase